MRAATTESPAFSRRRYTSPMRLALTPSGLTMDRVRSSGIRFGPLTKLHFGAGVRTGMQCRCAGQPGSLPWVKHPRQFGVRWKCRFGKAFCARQGDSNGETLPAAAFALDVRVSEAEGLVQTLLDEVHDRAVDQAEACAVHEHPHAAVLKHRVPGLRTVGVVDHVGKPGAAGLAHAEPQADALPASREETLDAICSGFSQ